MYVTLLVLIIQVVPRNGIIEAMGVDVFTALGTKFPITFQEISTNLHCFPAVYEHTNFTTISPALKALLIFFSPHDLFVY